MILSETEKEELQKYLQLLIYSQSGYFFSASFISVLSYSYLVKYIIINIKYAQIM